MIESPAIDGAVLAGLAVAMSVGLLVGIERERAKADDSGRAAAGVRTFLLLGLGGALAQLVGSVGIAVGGVFVAVAMHASYRRTDAADPGLTTEVAMLVVFLLGVLAIRATALAAALGVVTTVVLASKSRLHRFTREQLTEQELHDLLMLVAAAFVILPLLPDHALDPWGALNPRKLWLLVVAVMGVSSAGYVALRLFGARFGLALAGLAGGFVSSTATIAAMGDRARAEPAAAAAFAGAGLVSNVGTVLQLAVVLAALSPAVLARAAIPLAAAGAAAVVVALAANWRLFVDRAGALPDGMRLAGRRPFQPRRVLAFVAILATIMLLAAIAQRVMGSASLPWVLAASGLADVHASAASAAQLAAGGRIAPDAALFAIAVAFATNSLSKCVVAIASGGRAYAWRLVAGVVAIVVVLVLAILATATAAPAT